MFREMYGKVGISCVWYFGWSVFGWVIGFVLY